MRSPRRSQATSIRRSAGRLRRADGPHSLPAYEALLRARYYALGKADFGRSLASRGSDRDGSGFALAHSRLGTLFLMRLTAQAMPAHDAAPLARRHAQQALEIDPSLPEAHSTLGSIAAMCDYDWAEADRRFRLAFAQQIPSRSPHDTSESLPRARSPRARSGRGHGTSSCRRSTVLGRELGAGRCAPVRRQRRGGRHTLRAARRHRSVVGRSSRRPQRQSSGAWPDSRSTRVC